MFSVIHAQGSFTVKHIKIEGLHRVSSGTVLNYLPVEVGEEISPASTPQIIRALYDTGFFQSVELAQEGNTLIIKVVERETIGSISVVGNKAIPNDRLKEILKSLNLVKGRVFQRASLERLEKELKQNYNLKGNYNVRIDTKITSLTENRVSIQVTISEGRVSRIKSIKIIGAHDFSENELLPVLSLQSSGIFTYFSKKDQYSQGAMDTSLEALRSFYLDRGYLKYSLVSSQVLLSPDKKDVYIEIHIDEGPQYHFSGFDVVGKTIIPRAKVDSLILVKSGEVFSRKNVTESISAIGQALGDIGYGFPAINAEPRIDETNKTVFISFIINPGRHVYVRRINFHGNTRTADYVLRSVIRQDEGALMSLHNVKESERHLRQLNYLKNVDIKTTPVPEANNQVDIDITIEEAPSAEATASIGYGNTGPQFNAAFHQYNFMGTGRTLGLSFNASYWGQDYAVTYYNPFYTNTGIGRELSFYYQTVDPRSSLDISTYSADRLGGAVNYNLAITENSNLEYGYGYQGLKIKSTGGVIPIQNFIHQFGRQFNEVRFDGGWNQNTYDQMPFPTKGYNQHINGLVAVPGSSQSLSYYKTAYQGRLYQPLFKGFIFTAMGNVNYGNMFNGKGLPFFENYFAGGIAQPGQVRGYDTFSLGPQDNFGNSIGANLLTNATLGLILPYPLSRETFRTTIFSDMGNVFNIGAPAYLTGTKSGPLRFSAGLGLEWRSPLGPLAFSVAAPLNRQPYDQINFFQFSMMSSF